MAKELTHRADELKGLGWSQEDVVRYTELWDYRQRWGAINLEREDRLFLRKAEASLPEISKVKSSIKKPIKEKSYYRRLNFYLDDMNKAELKFNFEDGSRGVWAILIEEELRVLDYYEPILGLPDTLKSKLLEPLREDLVSNLIKGYQGNIQIHKFDFFSQLDSLKKSEPNTWRPLREGIDPSEQDYPVLNPQGIEGFRKEARKHLLKAIRENFPSLAESDKPSPPED